MRDLCLYKGIPGSFLTLLPPCEDAGKSAPMNKEAAHAGHPDPRLPASISVRDKSGGVHKPGYDASLQQPAWNETETWQGTGSSCSLRYGEGGISRPLQEPFRDDELS